MSKRKEAGEQGRKFSVAETKYEFRFRDVPLERLYKSLGKDSGEVIRSPTSKIDLSFRNTIDQRSRGSGYKQVL